MISIKKYLLVTLLLLGCGQSETHVVVQDATDDCVLTKTVSYDKELVKCKKNHFCYIVVETQEIECKQ